MSNISGCRAFSSRNLRVVWDLEKSPYGDLFQQVKSQATALAYHEMTLTLCGNCSLVQIVQETDIEQQYDQYLYNSTTTNGLGKFYTQTVSRLISDFSLKTDDLIIDIGSNDGTFLINFKNKGFQVLGIEPAEMSCRIAQERGVNTLHSYFDSNSVTEILTNHKLPKLISINYTLANIPDVHAFLKLVYEIMDDNSVLSIITGYHPDQFPINMFDYIGHDHLSYFTIESIEFLCNSLNLRVLDVSRVEHKGGSVQILISKNTSTREVQPSVSQMLQREKWLGTRSEDFYSALRFRIENSISQVAQILESEDFNSLNGVGASISTTYLSNQFGIAQKLSGLYDDDRNKIGRFAPGSGTEVFPLEALPSGEKCLTIILAWQHTEKLLSRLRENRFAGRVLIPLPTPVLLEI